jgi:beta-xylosidase
LLIELKLSGPWETAPAGVNPIVYNGTHPDIQNTGHMDLVKGHDDRWWAVFLGVRPVFQQTTQNGVPLMPSHLGRETFMAPVEWIDGWPVVNEKKPIELLGLAKGLKWVEDPNLSWRDDFDSKGDYFSLTRTTAVVKA